MNDFELDSKLRAARVPSRGDDYWERFPRRVAAQLRAAPAPAPAPVSWLPDWAEACAVAFACLAIAFCAWQSGAHSFCRLLLNDQKEIRLALVQFHDDVRTIMLDEHGLHKLVAEQQ